MNVSSGFLSKPVKQEDPPECFGKLWDNRSPECAGGPDVSFVPKTPNEAAGVDAQGTNVRRQCSWYQSCGARCAATRNVQGTLIPVQQFVRPPQQQAAPAPQPQQQQQTMAPQTFGQWLNKAQQEHMAGRPPVQVPQPPQYTQQPQMYAGAQVNPATTWQLNYTMPSYLSTPEIRHPGESIWAVLLREVLRAMGKALGHSVSHFFDARSFKE